MCALRLQHDEELQAIQAELEIMRLSQNPQPTSQPVTQPAQQTVHKPESPTVLRPRTQIETPPVLQPITQPNPLPTSPSILGLAPKTKKKKNKRKRKKPKKDDKNLDIQSLASELFRLSEEKRSQNFLGFVPQISPCLEFCQPPISSFYIPNISPPRRARIPPGIYPGIVPLMDIIFS